MVKNERPGELEIREYHINEDKTLITVKTDMDGGYDFLETTKRPSKGNIWKFGKSIEKDTFVQSLGPALPPRSDSTTFWEKHEINKGMVRTALDVCKETYVGSYSKLPYHPLSDEEWCAGKPDPDPREGRNKICVILASDS